LILGNLGNMGEMLKKAKDMQGNLKKVHEELREESYESDVEGVKCVVSGDMELKKLEISPSVLENPDKAKAERLIKEAVSSAMHEAKNIAKEKLRKVTGGLSIPGLF